MTGKTSVISSDIDIREPKNLNIDLVKTFAPTLLKANEKEWSLCISGHNKNIDNKIFEQRVMKEGPLLSDRVKCFLATYTCSL